MESSNKTMGIVVGIILVVLVIFGVIWFVNMDDNEETATQQDADSTQTEQVDEIEQTQEPDITELAADTEELSTLVTALEAAELTEVLQSDGPYTVFAPNNAAFDALPEGTLDDLLEPENQDQLTSILTYHVVAAEALSTDLVDGQEIETLQGETLTVSIEDDMVYLVDATGERATVTTPDIEASNGAVHIIDSVLMFE